MKYRITSLEYRKSKIKQGTFKALRKCRTPSVLTPETLKGDTEKINLDLLFEISELPEAQKKRKNPLSALRRGLAVIGSLFCAVGIFLWRCIRSLFTERKKRYQRLAFFSGVLCSSVLVALLSFAVVLFSLFGGFLAPFTLLRTPSLVGKSLDGISDTLRGGFDVAVTYEQSDTVPAGVVISQSPAEGITRKIYKNRPTPTLVLTVSSGKGFYTVGDFTGKSRRDCLLSLYNSGVRVNTVAEYSETVPSGFVISTLPATGSRLYNGEVLTLTVSMGKELASVRVPDLYGLSEAQAHSLLQSHSLAVGKITYKPSNLPAGKVVEQQYSPYSTLLEGATVDFTVSLGTATQKYVPDLYGLTVEEAKQALASKGLVIGGIFAAQSGAPKGTVITQTPAPGTPITSSITSVDIYISE